MPVPVVVPPGVLVRVHVPVAGNPLRVTLPVATPQMGWVIAPTTGAVGVGGWALITTWPETVEKQPSLLLTVKVWVPVASPVMVVLTPTLVVVAPLGMAVTVQVPVAGKSAQYHPARGNGAGGLGDGSNNRGCWSKRLGID